MIQWTIAGNIDLPELTRASARSLAQSIASGKASAREVVEAYLARIEIRNPPLNAIVDLDAEGARQAAAALDEKQARGEKLGPLHGIPITIKSAIDVSGMLCECGSRFRVDRRPGADAPLVRRLRNAGAVILGVTNAPDMLMAYETDNHLHGRTNNPWNPEYTPGGSSGGEAAAIAAGMTAGGFGSDGGGSIRVPAHFTGICGLKPTPGLIPRSGHWPPCEGPGALMGVVGPMARQAADLQMLFEAAVGPDDQDPSSAPVPVHPPNERQLDGLRVGWFDDDGQTPASPEVKAAVRRAAAALDDAGMRVERFDLRGMEGAWDGWRTFFSVVAATSIEPLIQEREDAVHPLARLLIASRDEALKVTYPQFLETWFQRDRHRAALLEQMRDVPVLLCPVAAVAAFRHGEREWQAGGRTVRYPGVFSYSQLFNYTGNPAAAVPAGATKDGMPVGVQIVGRPFEDALVLAVARRLQEALGHHPTKKELS